MEERLETRRRQGRREETCGWDILVCASSLHDGMVPSQAEDKNFLSIFVSEILGIFEWGTAPLRWQDPHLLSQLFQLVWSQSRRHCGVPLLRWLPRECFYKQGLMHVPRSPFNGDVQQLLTAWD